MVNLNGHEAGNGGHSQRTPKAHRGLLYSESDVYKRQLRISARAIDAGRHAQGVERNPERTGVDRRCGLERLFRVRRTREASYARRLRSYCHLASNPGRASRAFPTRSVILTIRDDGVEDLSSGHLPMAGFEVITVGRF